MIASTTDIGKLGTILSVWAHPDDETFAVGGIIAAATNNGQKVVCITATRGEAGVQDEARWPAKRLGAIREKELQQALKILGVKDHYQLGYPDGGCAGVDTNQAVQRIASLIETFKPDSILTFGPDGLTGHDDHKTVSNWTRLARNTVQSKATLYHVVCTYEQYAAMQEADKKLNIFFNIDEPPLRAEQDCAVCIKLPDELFERKRSALEAMPSQMEKLLGIFGEPFRDAMGTEALVDAG